jgi:hypothetical protein
MGKVYETRQSWRALALRRRIVSASPVLPGCTPRNVLSYRSPTQSAAGRHVCRGSSEEIRRCFSSTLSWLRRSLESCRSAASAYSSAPRLWRRSQIAQRAIWPESDVTRILDRLRPPACHARPAAPGGLCTARAGPARHLAARTESRAAVQIPRCGRAGFPECAPGRDLERHLLISRANPFRAGRPLQRRSTAGPRHGADKRGP